MVARSLPHFKMTSSIHHWYVVHMLCRRHVGISLRCCFLMPCAAAVWDALRGASSRVFIQQRLSNHKHSAVTTCEAPSGVSYSCDSSQRPDSPIHSITGHADGP
jgi:hypothetical protein